MRVARLYLARDGVLQRLYVGFEVFDEVIGHAALDELGLERPRGGGDGARCGEHILCWIRRGEYGRCRFVSNR